MQLPLKDLSGGAHERGALDAGVLAFAFDGHLDIDAALGVQHREVAHAGHHCRSAGDRARQGEGRGHADGAGDRMRGMAAAGREVARGDAVVVVASADQDRLRDHAGRDVAQPHALARCQAQPLQPFQQDRVGIQLGRRFPAGHAQVGGAHDHQRHRRVDAAHLDPVDQVDALPGREDRAGHRAPGVQEVQPDGGGGAGHAVDMGLALIGDAPLRRQHGHVDARPGVDVEDADRGLAILRGDQALLDGEGRHAREHVAAVGPGVHRTLADADLREQVVHVAVRLAGARDDGDLAGERAAAADAVHLQQIRRADRADQGRVALGLVGRQPVSQEERAARSAGTHQDTGKSDRLHGTDHPVLIDACELHCWDQLIDWRHQ